MKVNQVIENTTSGSVATVATSLFKPNRKTGNLLIGKKTKKKYANSIAEGAMKELSLDLTPGIDGLSDEEFKKKYKKTKEQMKKSLEKKPNPDEYNKKVDEAKLKEDDVIMMPGMGHKLKSGFIPHSKDRTNHEIEMTLTDLYQAAKNAKAIYSLISKLSEKDGLASRIQEKITRANDNLNTVREYLEQHQVSKKGIQENSSRFTKKKNMRLSEIHTMGSSFDQNIVSEDIALAQSRLKIIFDIVKTNKPAIIPIGNKSGNVTPAMAKAIVQLYNLAKVRNKTDDILKLFLDDELFKKLLKNPTYRKLVHHYTQEKMPNLTGNQALVMYNTIYNQHERKQKKYTA